MTHRHVYHGSHLLQQLHIYDYRSIFRVWPSGFITSDFRQQTPFISTWSCQNTAPLRPCFGFTLLQWEEINIIVQDFFLFVQWAESMPCVYIPEFLHNLCFKPSHCHKTGKTFLLFYGHFLNEKHKLRLSEIHFMPDSFVWWFLFDGSVTRSDVSVWGKLRGRSHSTDLKSFISNMFHIYDDISCCVGRTQKTEECASFRLIYRKKRQPVKGKKKMEAGEGERS